MTAQQIIFQVETLMEFQHSDLTNNKENAPLGYTAEELLKKKSKGEKGTEAQVYFQVKEKRLLYIIIIEYASEKIDLIIIIIISI